MPHVSAPPLTASKRLQAGIVVASAVTAVPRRGFGPEDSKFWAVQVRMYDDGRFQVLGRGRGPQRRPSPPSSLLMTKFGKEAVDHDAVLLPPPSPRAMVPSSSATGGHGAVLLHRPPPPPATLPSSSAANLVDFSLGTDTSGKAPGWWSCQLVYSTIGGGEKRERR
uniref:Uncharacterized protein n=1 Tax=Oryza sativa subsp. japonica TaxID=39947 RepID=Q6EPF5_ORYSJ|nr:hypothetical protein [Oryza sativa Japonica Group]